MRTTGHRMPRSLLIVGLAMSALLLLLVAAAPALAADGVQVWAGKDMASAKWQGETQLAGNFVVWTQKDDVITGGGGYQYQVYLADLTTGSFIKLHDDMAMEQHVPQVVVQDGLITVVWVEDYGDEAGYHSHLWIWQGTEEAGTHFTPTPDPSAPDPGNPTSAFPRYLVMGKVDYSADPPVQIECNQSSPSLGLVAEPQSGVAGDHLVVAWEDFRDLSEVPQTYYADLTSGIYAADSTTYLWDTGMAVDLTDVLARGEYSPAVGPRGVFWLDDRYSIWSPGQMMATDVRFSNFASGGPDTTTPSVSLYSDVPAVDDNDGLVATANGAAWLHNGPYPNGREEPLAAKVSGSAALLTTTMLPNGYTSRALNSAWAGSAANTYYALVGLHGDSTTGDEDVFFYDPTTGARVPVCDRGQTSYADDPAGRTARFDNTSDQPAISVVPDPVNPGAHLPFERVVWMDGKLNTVVDPEGDGMTQLFEAFVPSVSLRARVSSLLRLRTDTITATVGPNFSGKSVSLQLVKRVAVLGQTQYKLVKTLGTKALSSTSSVAFSWKPRAKGTFYVRAWFGGGTKYYADGTTTAPASGFDYQIPHVGNYSKVLRIVVRNRPMRAGGGGGAAAPPPLSHLAAGTCDDTPRVLRAMRPVSLHVK